MWQFIPRNPGKLAWIQKPFHSYVHLDDVVAVLTGHTFRGLLEIKGMKAVDEVVLSSDQWMDGADLQIPFQNTAQLKSYIEIYRLKSLPLDRISKVYLYDVGYFVK